MWWTWTVALAQHPTAPTDEVLVEGDPWAVRVTGYLLPRQDPAWITDESPVRSCTVGVRYVVGQPLEVTPKACPEPMPEPMLAATRAWTFEPAVEPSEGGTTFEIRYVVSYSEVIQVMTLHAEVDPGAERAFAGDQGSPGLKLVHPATLVAGKPAKLKGGADQRCRLRLTVDGDGEVAASEPVDCPDALLEAAGKVVRKWRYTPRVVDGTTLPEVVEVDVPFR